VRGLAGNRHGITDPAAPVGAARLTFPDELLTSDSMLKLVLQADQRISLWRADNTLALQMPRFDHSFLLIRPTRVLGKAAINSDESQLAHWRTGDIWVWDRRRQARQVEATESK
jgi:hypothetical protein